MSYYPPAHPSRRSAALPAHTSATAGGAAAISMLDPMAMNNYDFRKHPGTQSVQQQHYGAPNASASISMMGPPPSNYGLSSAASISMMPGPEPAHPWSQMPPQVGHSLSMPSTPAQHIPQPQPFTRSQTAPPVPRASYAVQPVPPMRPVAPSPFPAAAAKPQTHNNSQQQHKAPQYAYRQQQHRAAAPAAKPQQPAVPPRTAYRATPRATSVPPSKKATNPTNSRAAVPQAPHSAPVNRKEVIKKQVLTSWAFIAPHNPNMRPLVVLLATIHKVFPPFADIPTHAYFMSWKPPPTNNAPKDTEKALRKLRFLLHPDKIPKNLHPDATYLCEFLWEIISHVVEEQKR